METMNTAASTINKLSRELEVRERVLEKVHQVGAFCIVDDNLKNVMYAVFV